MIFYKIGCYVLIVTCLLHLVGHFSGPTPTNEGEKQLLDMMTNFKMDVGTGTITMMGIQKGFSLTFALLFLWTGGLSLFLVKQLGNNVPLIRRIAGLNASALLIALGISSIYFFFIPTICIALGLIFFSLATIRLKSQEI